MNSLAGQAVGGVKAVEPARKIVEDMVTEAGGFPGKVGPFPGGQHIYLAFSHWAPKSTLM